MICAQQLLARLPAGEHKHVTIRTALPGDGPRSDLKFLDHLQKKYSEQVGFLPLQVLEWNIERGNVSIALENDEPAAYLLGKGNYLRDPYFGIIYQAAVSYDARRRLMGTALVQHFIADVPAMRATRLVGLWCAQDIEANEFWHACGFEAIAARHGSRRKGRVHIFWVGRTPAPGGAQEPLRYPKYTQGGLMREQREVFGLAPGSEYKDVELPELAAEENPHPQSLSQGAREAKPRSGAKKRPGSRMSLIEQQRAFRYGHSQHICVVVSGVTKYLPVAPFDVPNFADLARTMVGAQAGAVLESKARHVRPAGELWSPALGQ